MNNTIEQRAVAYLKHKEHSSDSFAIRNAYIAGATEERALIEQQTASLEERVKELEALKSLILDIDFMTTTEFCKAYGYDVPQWTGSKEVAVMDFLAIDARKWNIVKEAAKGRINPKQQ